MCQLFIDADAELWMSSTRSIRIDGMVTSVRLENYFWQTLETIAKRDGMNIPQILSRLYKESIEAEHDLGNFTSFLRVCCMRYLSLQLSGDISSDVHIPLSSYNAEEILNKTRESAFKAPSYLIDNTPVRPKLCTGAWQKK